MLPEHSASRVNPADCWLYQGYTSKGYGRVRYQGRRWQIHRLFYTMLVGPIPEGMTLDHLCRDRSCFRPDHLEPVPNRVNVLRGIGHSAANARKTHCHRGHPFDAANTHIDPSGRRRCRACHRKPWRRLSIEVREAK